MGRTQEGLWKVPLPRASEALGFLAEGCRERCLSGWASLLLFESSPQSTGPESSLKRQLIVCEDRPLLPQLVGVPAHGGGPRPRHSGSQYACQQCCVTQPSPMSSPSLWIQETSCSVVLASPFPFLDGDTDVSQVDSPLGCHRDTLFIKMSLKL